VKVDSTARATAATAKCTSSRMVILVFGAGSGTRHGPHLAAGPLSLDWAR